jgi:hypothetical protein
MTPTYRVAKTAYERSPVAERNFASSFVPLGSFGANAIEKTSSAGIAGRMRHVISPDSSSHQPEVKRPIESEKTARLMRVIGKGDEPPGTKPSSPALAVVRSAAPMTTSVMSSSTVADSPE